jgi:hypothetical protein
VGEINFSSFPRSGNHFANDLIKNYLPNVTTNWDGSHRASFLDNKTNCFTIIRKPEDCIASWIIYNKDTREKRIDRVTEWYVAFYEQCIKNKIPTVLFPVLITEPITVLRFLCNIFNIENKESNEFDLDKLNKNATKTTKKQEVEQIKSEVANSKFYSRAIGIFNEFN